MDDTDIEILIDNVRAMSKKPSAEFKAEVVECLNYLHREVKRLRKHSFGAREAVRALGDD